MKFKPSTTNIITFLLAFVLILIPTLFVSAERHEIAYKPMVGLPGIAEPNEELRDFTFNDLINALYMLSISIAGLLAVIKVVIAGIKWMTSDLISSKESAKKDITGALFGLIIVLSAVLILTVINRDIIEVDLSFPNVKETAPGGQTIGKPQTRTINCTTPQGQGTYDCTTAESACKDTQGTPSPQAGGRSILCTQS